MNLKTNKNWLRVFSLSSLLILATSCSNDEVVEDNLLSTAAKSANSIELSYNSITASAQQSANPIGNIDDSDSSLSTRWSGEGRDTEVDIDFGTEVTVDYVNIAFHKGDERKAYFSYWFSDDGNNWTEAGSKTSSGNTDSHEEFDLTNMTARYVRLLFEGNENSSWNSVLDLEVYGTTGSDEPNNNSTYTSVPSKIEAEDFDSQSGIRTENTSDSGGGTNVGYIDSGDSLSYNINVPSSGEYTVDFRLASRTNGSEFDIYQGNSKIGSISSNRTGGWQTWETVSTDVNLSSGDQTLRLVATGSGWNINWLEVKESNGGTTDTPTTDTGDLDPNKTPAENFDLSQWKLTPSSGNDVSVSDLNNNFEISNQFYTGSDGGMVFKNYPEGAGTTTNSTYSRVEFREMLDTSADDTSISKNNWVFSSSSSSNENNSGGVGGTLTATLAVNRVTTTSDSDHQMGRIVIGQIHASDNEPCRLYYKLMPGDTKGAIYFVHEDSNGVESAVNIIGDFAIEETGSSAGDYTGASEPSNGIPFGEVFSYKIEVIGTMLYVDIYRDGAADVSGEYNMSGSGYANDWMYFKAGLYSQNKTVKSASDYEQVTFYALENTHN